MKKSTKTKTKKTTTTNMVETPVSTTVAKKTPVGAMGFKGDKNVVVRPKMVYTVNEVRNILCLGKKSFLVPSHFSGMRVRHGLIQGASVIAHLERISNTKGPGRRSLVKIGRKYKSGSVTVVAR